MKRIRFRIASLLALVGFVAFGIAALRAADEPWDSAILALTLLALAAGTLLAVLRHGRRRAFWLGFMIFGWMAFAVNHVPGMNERLPWTKGLRWVDSKIPGKQSTTAYSYLMLSRLITKAQLDYQAVVPQSQGTTFVDVTGSSGQAGTSGLKLLRFLGTPARTSEYFVQIGQSLVAILLAFVGGKLGSMVFREPLAPALSAACPTPSTHSQPESES
jgi:hypothetical protein